MATNAQWIASAPAKVILLGEHAVNRAQPALVTAVDLRVTCAVTARPDRRYVLRTADRSLEHAPEDLEELRRTVDGWRAAGDLDAIARLARDEFFAPMAYVLATFLAHAVPRGLTIAWQSAIPIGSGLGSGAACASAMLLALCDATGVTLDAQERARLAWQGDIIAHGGVASGLDSAGTTFGGIVRYSVADGPEPLDGVAPLPLVIGDTRIRASTAAVNSGVRRWLAEHPEGAALFPVIGDLVARARAAIAAADLPELGRLLDDNQAVLAQVGVSCTAIERLTGAAHTAGALGAKLSGSGGGGIIVALCAEGTSDAVAAAIEVAGGRAIVTRAGVEGARIEPTGPAFDSRSGD
jgi:mevalonate kinase